MDDDDGKLKKTLEVEGASRSVADPRRGGGGGGSLFRPGKLGTFSSSFHGAGSSSNEGE